MDIMLLNNLPLHFIEDEGHYLTWTRYGQTNGHVAAVVATVTITQSHHIIDWTCYWGGSDKCQKEFDAIKHIAWETGNKTSRRDAAYFFPDLPIELLKN